MPNIYIKRGLNNALTAVNPVLGSGEMVYVRDTNTIVVGNGSGVFSSLSGINATPLTHSHVVSDITNFNSSVSGLLPTVANSGDNRILTSTGSSVGINAEANLTFNGNTLGVVGDATFTGAATFANTGNVVPLTVTNTGTANSFVVNDESGDASPFVISNAGNVGIGAAPGTTLDIQRASADAAVFVQGQTSSTGATVQMYSGAGIAYIGTRTNHPLVITTNNAERVKIEAAGAVIVTSPLTLTGTVAGNVRQLKLQTSGVDRWQITPSFDAETGSNAGSNFHITRWSDAGSFMGTPLYITRSTGIVNCESGLTIVSGQLLVTAGSGSAGSYKPGVAISGDDDTGVQRVGGANTISLVTAGSERVRVDASGNVLVGQTTTTDPAGANTNGVAIATDYISVSRSSFECLRLNLKAADGTIVALFQDAVLEGSISIAGNTVSYNAFCGSHWSQLIDNSKPEILRGTVLETLDETCEWIDGKSDRLVRVKISDIPKSKRVYGVFLGWDENYASTGDMYVAGLGAYYVRVKGIVQSGDLLESAGDGTAIAQNDDIVRSSTIGKVSSVNKITEYSDDSYLVACTLMCG